MMIRGFSLKNPLRVFFCCVLFLGFSLALFGFDPSSDIGKKSVEPSGKSGTATHSCASLLEEAFRLRNSGNIDDASRVLRLAIGAARKPVQKKLAQFMLGDCLIEIK